MLEYASPEVEFIDFVANDIFTSSNCEEEYDECDYVCPDEYGNTCTGNPYGGM